MQGIRGGFIPGTYLKFEDDDAKSHYVLCARRVGTCRTGDPGDPTERRTNLRMLKPNFGIYKILFLILTILA